MSDPQGATRWLDLAGAENVRDLGGLPLITGGVTRRGVLLRSDTLQELTAGDVALLRSIGLRTVIDLRAPAEVVREGRGPLADEPIGYANLPFMTDAIVSGAAPDRGTAARAPDLIVADRKESARVRHYLSYLRLAGDRVVAAVRIMASDPPALFHCAAGKDRTGVLAALVLDAVGVEREAIIADFALTNERLDGIEGRLRRLPTYAAYAATLAPGDMFADPTTMSDVLATVDRDDGGAASWLLAHGLSMLELERLRSALAG